MIEMPDFLEELVNAGISPTIHKNDKLGVYFDLNTMAKSEMHLYKKDNQWRVAMRYDEDHVVEDADDLKILGRHAMHGRDYINADWAEFINS